MDRASLNNCLSHEKHKDEEKFAIKSKIGFQRGQGKAIRTPFRLCSAIVLFSPLSFTAFPFRWGYNTAWQCHTPVSATLTRAGTGDRKTFGTRQERVSPLCFPMSALPKKNNWRFLSEEHDGKKLSRSRIHLAV